MRVVNKFWQVTYLALRPQRLWVKVNFKYIHFVSLLEHAVLDGAQCEF